MFRCPQCNTLYMRLPGYETPCRTCNSTFIDPALIKDGDLAIKKWKECGLYNAFRRV